MGNVLDIHRTSEALVERLNDPQTLREYKTPCDSYRPALVPRILGKMLVFCGNLVYGHEPSYLKFRAVEVIARVPYHSWESAAYTLMTLFYRDAKKARALSEIAHFSRHAQDNETMHVVVISELAKRNGDGGFFRHTLIPLLFAFFYYWAGYILYMVNPRYSLELNYLFENHAFSQYDRFLNLHGEELKKKFVGSDFLLWYGRDPSNEYEFFRSVRNDELIHRNRSVHDIGLHTKKVMN